MYFIPDDNIALILAKPGISKLKQRYENYIDVYKHYSSVLFDKRCQLFIFEAKKWPKRPKFWLSDYIIISALQKFKFNLQGSFITLALPQAEQLTKSWKGVQRTPTQYQG